MKEAIAEQLDPILTTYDPKAPQFTADRLRDLWLGFEPGSMHGIKAEARSGGMSDATEPGGKRRHEHAEIVKQA